MDGHYYRLLHSDIQYILHAAHCLYGIDFLSQFLHVQYVHSSYHGGCIASSRLEKLKQMVPESPDEIWKCCIADSLLKTRD